MRNLFVIFLSLILVSMPALSVGFDSSLDDEIRQKYSLSKIEEDKLPPLPQTYKPADSVPVEKKKVEYFQVIPDDELPTPTTAKPQIDSGDFQKYPQAVKKYPLANSVHLNNWKTFRVLSSQNISDGLREGTRLTFKTKSNTNLGKGQVLPAGTVFRGYVEDSHLPQLSGNGGLVVIAIDSVTYSGRTTDIDAKITKVVPKKIFFNNIKGERKYLDSVVSSLSPGKKFLNKMMNWTSSLANKGLLCILCPVTAVAGVVVYGVNFVGAPVFGLFSKGGRVYIPASTEFEIKMLDGADI